MNTFFRIAAAIGAIGMARIGIEAVLILSQTDVLYAYATAWAFLFLVMRHVYLAVRGFET